jgi:hypothetical protein
VPVIVFAVSVGDWGSRELLRGDVLQTAQIDTINSTLPGNISYGERAHATVLAEIVLVAHCIEQIFGEFRLARKKTESLWLHYGWPKRFLEQIEQLHL